MKTLVLVALSLVTLAGCSALGSSATSASLVNDLTLGTACVGEVQSSAPACLAEVPSCVALGKGVVSQVKPATK
jgi:hypothetical protein